MTGSTRRPPGTTLLKIARLVFNDQLLSAVVQPTIADLQREIRDAGRSRPDRLRARWRGYRAFWRIVIVAPFASWPGPVHDTGAIAFPDMVGRLGAAAILVALIAIVGPVLGVWAAVITAAGTFCALLLHRWYDRHPSDLPAPAEPQRSATPQINFSSTEVAGNIGGLIFVVGSVFIVAIGLPSVIWFLFAATAAGCFLAWALVVWHTKHPKRGLPENQIVLR